MIKRSFAITRILSRTEESLSVEWFSDHSRSNAIVGVLSECPFFVPLGRVRRANVRRRGAALLHMDSDGEDALTQLLDDSATALPSVPPRDSRPFACKPRESPSRGRDGSRRSPSPPLVTASRSLRRSPVRHARAASWSACAAMWRASQLLWSVSAVTATAWWSTRWSTPFATPPMCAVQGVRMLREAGCQERPVRATGIDGAHPCAPPALGDLRSSKSALLPICHRPPGRNGASSAMPSGALSRRTWPNARHRCLVVPALAPEPVQDDAETTRSQSPAAMTWAQRAAPACSRSTSANARTAVHRFVCSCVLYRDVQMSREAGCRERHHRPEGNRGHPGTPRVRAARVPTPMRHLTVRPSGIATVPPLSVLR